jgi:hypothetical protein
MRQSDEDGLEDASPGEIDIRDKRELASSGPSNVIIATDSHKNSKHGHRRIRRTGRAISAAKNR